MRLHFPDDNINQFQNTLAKVTNNPNSINLFPGHILFPAPNGANTETAADCVSLLSFNHLSGKYSFALVKFSSELQANFVWHITKVCKIQ